MTNVRVQVSKGPDLGFHSFVQVPATGDFVSTPQGNFKVIGVHHLSGNPAGGRPYAEVLIFVVRSN